MTNCPRCGSGDKYVRVFGHYENGQKVGVFVGCWQCGYKTVVCQSAEDALKIWEDIEWRK